MQQVSEIYHSEIYPFFKTITYPILCDKLSQKVDLKYLNSVISVSFDPQQFWHSFIHKSFAHEFHSDIDNNERLEFLGDSVLAFYVTKKLFSDAKLLSEGEMSKRRSQIVSEKQLAQAARKLGLGQFLLVGKGELKSKGHEKDSLLSDAFEALLGNMSLCFGQDSVENFLDGWTFFQQIMSISENNIDYKTQLQEFCMKHFNQLPHYEGVEVGNEFEVAVHLGKNQIDKIHHYSKKKGMQLVAQSALLKLQESL